MTIQEAETIKEVACVIGIKPHEVIDDLISMGQFWGVDMRINEAVIQGICEKHNFPYN